MRSSVTELMVLSRDQKVTAAIEKELVSITFVSPSVSVCLIKEKRALRAKQNGEEVSPISEEAEPGDDQSKKYRSIAETHLISVRSVLFFIYQLYQV
jgi:hypothetical protein